MTLHDAGWLLGLYSKQGQSRPKLVPLLICVTILRMALQDFEKIYTRLDIHGLTERGESFYNPMLPGVVEDLVERGIATDSNGATCVFIEVGAVHSLCERAVPACRCNATVSITLFVWLVEFSFLSVGNQIQFW